MRWLNAFCASSRCTENELPRKINPLKIAGIRRRVRRERSRRCGSAAPGSASPCRRLPPAPRDFTLILPFHDARTPPKYSLASSSSQNEPSSRIFFKTLGGTAPGCSIRAPSFFCAFWKMRLRLLNLCCVQSLSPCLDNPLLVQESFRPPSRSQVLCREL